MHTGTVDTYVDAEGYARPRWIASLTIETYLQNLISVRLSKVCRGIDYFIGLLAFKNLKDLIRLSF